MNDETSEFALRCTDPTEAAPVLAGVTVECRMDAALLETTLRQTYRNTSSEPLEVVYTFPLPASAVLLDFASTLNGRRQAAVVVAREQAEQQYEESLQKGDAPAMLEAQDDGLHTANIGNLRPGDEVVLECRFVQTLGFEQGRFRVAIPTTVAPRYGSPARAGLQPQQVPHASLDAEYPLSVSLRLGASLLGAALECPTHRAETIQESGKAVGLALCAGARLDRDVVFVIVPRESRPSLLVRAPDPFDPQAPVVTMAALQLPPAPACDRIAVKLLVDCSGSMNGDSIASARAALNGVLAGLGEQDTVSVSRFGSTVELVFGPSSADERSMRLLKPVIDGFQADLGGTEMAAALTSVFGLRSNAGAGADVLLITDGDIWQADEVVAAARASGHRVFVVGVGSSPAEGVLRRLAEATGGACEFATPGEALQAASRRMLRRMRQAPIDGVRVDWGCKPAWAVDPSASVFGGDTVIAMAGFAKGEPVGPVRLLAEDATGRTVELARGEADAPCAGDMLPRLAAARRLPGLDDAQSLALATRYQLLTRQTHCILVHQRDDAERLHQEARLHRVHSMLAAGWGGMCAAETVDSRYRPEVDLAAPRHMAAAVDRFADLFFGAGHVHGSLERHAPPASLEDLARFIVARLARGAPVSGTAADVESQMEIHAEVRQAIEQAVHAGLTRDQAWLALALWIHDRPGGLGEVATEAQLQCHVRAMEQQPMSGAMRIFDRTLGGFAMDGWRLARAERLRRAVLRDQQPATKR